MKQWLVRRGLLAIVPIALVGLAFSACTSESGPANSERGRGDHAEVARADGEELKALPVASERFARLSKRFIRNPVEPAEPAPYQFPPGMIPPNPAPAREPLLSVPVLSKGDARSFLRQGERFRAQIDSALKPKTIRPATVDLPAAADGFVRVQPEGSAIGVEFATNGARGRAQIEVADGIASYPNGAPEGGDMVFRVTADSVEDFVVLDRKPTTPRVAYTVNVAEVPGLRLYDNTLEFLDAKGDPQIRVKPPRVVDADGTTHEATLSVNGCKFDTSGQLPWDRPVTAPGASRCEVSVSWNDATVAYPAIVDPVWATAGSLATARYRAAAVRLSTGFVMTCGGIGDLGIAIKSCETFNPAGGGGAGTWAAATAMGTARNDHTMFVLSPASTDVLAVGGSGTLTSERLTGGVWAASTGDFSGATVGCPSCTTYFNPQMPAMTSDGNYVVLIDSYNTPYKFSTATNAWTVGTTNPSPIQPYRYSAHILQIPGQNTIMRVGGYYSSTYFSSAERYRPSTDSWSTPGNATAMTVPRADAATALLDGNRLMIYGGYTGAISSPTAEIYNGTANTWSFTTGPLPNGGSASQGYRGVTAAFHGAGKMLSNSDSGMYIYDPAAASTPWAALSTNNFNTLGSSANIATAGSKVLMVPIWPSGGPSGPQTACRLFDFGDKGSACYSTGECQNGLTCVRDIVSNPSQYAFYPGVCCDTACTNACSACEAARKTSGPDGTCGPRVATDYVGETACPASAATTCGISGYYCDGAGACAKWSNTTQCGATSCVDGDTQNNQRLCDGKGVCLAQTTSDCAAGYKCSGNACLTYCYNDVDYCASNYYCQDWKATYYTCQPKKSSGTACTYPTECTTGFCVDGVCCDKACNGTCEACTNALTGQSTGSCKPIPAGTDTQNECQDSGTANCGQNGLCNGAAACQLYASGTVCQAASCASPTSRNVPDTCNGTGTCSDAGVQNCAAGYACLSGVCQTSCTDDTACASAYHCDTVAKQCVADKTQGQACPRDSACSGNSNCVDGVCCDSACSGTCRSCLKNRTGLAADGVCGNILDDTDPESECATDVGYPASCKAPGLCDGTGACRVYAKVATVAKANVCTGSTLTQTSCDGAGNLDPRESPCYPYKCNAAGNGCRATCSSSADCTGDAFCNAATGSCFGQKPDGAECRDNDECLNKHCANIGKEPKAPDTGAGGDGAGGAANDDPDPPSDAPGVCCNTDCDNDCEACKKSIKGEGVDGLCGPVKDHTDPAGDCGFFPPCGHNGECDGERRCRNVPGGTACGATKCVGNSVQGQRCDGQGACINNDGTTACAPYVCREVGAAEQCTNPCADDNDCADGYYCSEMACKKKLANGKVCNSNGICNSGFCVDGVCCDVSCNGQCEACDAAGSEGVCQAVKGEPHGARPQCDHAGEECGGACDGVNPAACKYKPNGDACGTPTCDNDLAKSSSCNGQGECKANKNTECSPYTCGPDDVCLERCELDADCGQGYACDETTQRCLPSAVAATCSEDRLTSQGQNGADTPCKPFLCVPASGTCAVSCAFTTDCSPDFVCEPSTKTCLPAPADSGASDDTSCACRAAGAAPNRSDYLALAVLGLALTGLRRRQRSRKPAHVSTKPRGFASASQPSE